VDLNGNINMIKTKKDLIQEKIEETIILNNCRGIVLSSVRSGKTKMLLESVKKYSKEENITILLLYPYLDIKVSWENEMNRIDYHPNITYCTFASIAKIKLDGWDFVIIDEAHLLGEENQLPIAGEIADYNECVIFASGTYNKNTLYNIKIHTGMELIVNYSTEQAVEDGIISDFTIFIHKYELNNFEIVEYGKSKKWKSTEKRECNRLGARVINSVGQGKMFAALERMRFINTNQTLTKKVKHWIKENFDQRFILFVSDEKTGTRYEIPMFNSKSKNDTVLKEFQAGIINHLCLIKKASAGVTFPNLQNILITAINSNGENLEQMVGRSLLDDTEHSNIHIFVSTEEFQLKWLIKSLEGIDKNRVKYV
jgi:superfamily II DNA or RNA helicase